MSQRTAAPCHFVRANGALDLGGWLRARRLVDTLRPDIIHFVNPVFWMSLALYDYRQPKVLHAHGPLDSGKPPFREDCIWRIFRRLITRFVCVSRDMETKILAAKWAVPQQVRTIYNAVDCDRWAQRLDPADARAKLGLPTDKTLLGMVCRLVPAKGCEDGVRLLEHLPERYHLVIAGDGPEKRNIADLAAAMGLSGRVHLVGLLDDASLAYSAFDYLLFLSRNESFGLLLAEAMAAGVPVVGLAGEGGYREGPKPLVTPETAILIGRREPNGQEAAVAPAPVLRRLAEEIQSLDRSPERRSAMVELARQRIRSKFGAEQYAASMVRVYEELPRLASR